MRRAYLKVRRWVDFDLAGSSRPLSILLPITLFVSGVPLGAYRSDFFVLFGIPLLCLTFAISGFLVWRCIRLTAALDLRADRRRKKNDLPPEYANTVSAATTARLLRSRRKRERR